MHEVILNSNTRDGLFSAAKSEMAVPHPDVARLVRAARPNCDKQRWNFDDNFTYLF
jgi:hypothetical protein